MEKQIIMFQNITIAVRAKNILDHAGIHGYVQKTPVQNNKPTCGYSVVVKDKAEYATEILREKGIVILGVTSVSRE